MSLPKIDVPTYQLIIPSTKQNVTYRPFLVKEEKILLMALSGDKPDPLEMLRAVKQIVNNCILTPDLDVDKLYQYDLEYIFLQLRIRSQGQKLSLRFEPIKNSTCEECQKQRVVETDLTEAEVIFNPEHNDKIMLTESLGMKMKAPSLQVMTNLSKIGNSSEVVVEEYMKMIWECVDFVFDKEKMYKARDYKPEEGIAFLEELNQEQFAEIEKFFRTLPKLKLDVKVKCSKCTFEDVYPIVGLENFFV